MRGSTLLSDSVADAACWVGCVRSLHRIKKLLKPLDTQTYAELTATFAEGENIVAPPIRYHFGKKAKSNSKLAA